MNLPLTKTLDPADFELLGPELQIVDRHFTRAREQHSARRWEYAMALRAYDVWAQQDYERHGHANRTHGGRMVDVGGAGSPFRFMLDEIYPIKVIDPEENTTLAQHIRYAGLASCVFCLSVLEHVDDLDQFLYHLSCLVAPGGLLFLTMDCREDDRDLANRVGDWCWPTDDRHFYWMRKRIFTPRMLQDCIEQPLTYLEFRELGTADRAYHGNHVYDYTFASLALIKRS